MTDPAIDRTIRGLDALANVDHPALVASVTDQVMGIAARSGTVLNGDAREAVRLAATLAVSTMLNVWLLAADGITEP